LVSIPVLLAALCLILAAVSDFRSYRISNIFPALLLLLFLATRLYWGFAVTDWSHLLHFVIALAAGMVLFQMGWIGGGDAKLYAGAAIWFSGINAAFLIFATGLAGFVLAVAFVMTRKMRRRADPSRRSERRIPYGVAIAGGALTLGAIVGLNGLVPLA
jgi:prepilin peptidase CpaA